MSRHVALNPPRPGVYIVKLQEHRPDKPVYSYWDGSIWCMYSGDPDAASRYAGSETADTVLDWQAINRAEPLAKHPTTTGTYKVWSPSEGPGYVYSYWNGKFWCSMTRTAERAPDYKNSRSGQSVTRWEAVEPKVGEPKKPAFANGDQVECIDSSGCGALVVGQVYYVNSVSKDDLVAVSLAGKLMGHSFAQRFRLAKKASLTGSGEVQRTSPIRLARALPRRLLLL